MEDVLKTLLTSQRVKVFPLAPDLLLKSASVNLGILEAECIQYHLNHFEEIPSNHKQKARISMQSRWKPLKY